MANKSIFTGRISQEPQLKETSNGKAVCYFNLAVRKKYKQNEAIYVKFVAFNQQAEYIGKYAKKGMLVEVESVFNLYTKPNTEPPQQDWSFEVTDFEILSSKKEMEAYNNKSEVENLPNRRMQKPQQQLIEDTTEYPDIPF